MTAAKSRFILLVAWLVSFFVNGLSILYLYVSRGIERDNFILFLREMISLYAPYVGAMCTFYLTPRLQKHHADQHVGVQLGIALVATLFWNLGLSAFTLPLLVGVGKVETAIKDCADFAALAGWLVGPAMGFYFAFSGGTRSRAHK